MGELEKRQLRQHDNFLEKRRHQQITNLLYHVPCIVIVRLGLAVLTGQLGCFSNWPLAAFTALTNIG